MRIKAKNRALSARVFFSLLVHIFDCNSSINSGVLMEVGTEPRPRAKLTRARSGSANLTSIAFNS